MVRESFLFPGNRLSPEPGHTDVTTFSYEDSLPEVILLINPITLQKKSQLPNIRGNQKARSFLKIAGTVMVML